ncbi:MAG: hypothetical protein ACJ75Z_01550 [Solirubrobacterales bacterium]
MPRRYVGPSAASAPKRRAPSGGPEPEGKSPDARAWDKLLLLVGAAVAVAALLIVPGIVNRGGENPIAEAAQATKDSPGVRMAFTMSVQGPVQMSMQGSGVLNGETKRASVHMEATGGTGGFQMDEIVDGLDIYMHSPAFGAVAGGKSWLKISGSAFGDLPSYSDQLGGAGTSFGPTQALDALESVSGGVTNAGPETVNGVNTTHYTATIDLGAIFDKVKDHLPDQMAQMLGDAVDGQPGMPVDAWVDDQGLLRRERFSFSLGPVGSISMTIDFSDYGIHPQVDVPSESDVYDATPLLQQQLGG